MNNRKSLNELYFFLKKNNIKSFSRHGHQFLELDFVFVYIFYLEKKMKFYERKVHILKN